MSEQKHIGVYRGTTPDFLAVLQELRRRMPEARITVMSPPGYENDEAVAALADAVVPTECAAYSLRQPAAVLRLVRQLRAQRFDVFITLYRTMQQQALAVASGAPHAEAWCWDQRIRVFATTWRGLLWATLRGRARGLCVRAACHTRVYLSRFSRRP